MKILPRVSIVIPTYNEEKNIGRCLDSVFKQKYPKDKLEVIVVDDSSTDRTLEIVKKFPTKVITHDSKHGEVGKMLGFRKAIGEFAIYLDADIELRGSHWFQKMLKPLLENPEIIGSFTRYYSRKSDPAIERFLCFDPLQRDSPYQFFSPAVEETVDKDCNDYSICRYQEEKIPPAGLCLYRRSKLLNLVGDYDMFLELDFLVILVKNRLNKFAYVPSAGLYHHHVSSLKELLRKRRYNVEKVYLKTIDRKLYKWFDLSKSRDILKIIFWILYANLFVPSLFVGFYKSLRYKDWAGMYEPVVNFLVTNTILLSFLVDVRTTRLLKKN